MNRDSIIIILSHANDEYKKHVLKECLKNLNGETLLSTNYPVDLETQKMCDWVIYDKKNEIIKKENYEKYNLYFDDCEFDHGYSVYSLIRNGIRFANSIGKKKVHIVNYDYILDVSEFETNDFLLDNFEFIPYKNKEVSGDKSYSGAIISGKIDSFLKFSSYYKSFDEYYTIDIPINTFEHKMFNILHSITTNIFVKYEKDLINKNGVNLIKSVNFNYKNSNTNRFKEIGLKYNTDKVYRHKYHEIYPSLFDKFTDKEINLFEIGIHQGGSLKLWEEFAPNCNIFGMEINNELITDKFKIFKGDQSKISDLDKIIYQIPKCNIIIDDGCHIPNIQIKTFNHLFKNLLEDGGFYVIEDIECSYWNPLDSIYGYEVGYLNIVDYFVKHNHQVNSEYNSFPNDLNIKKITYFPNCIIIEKGY